MVSLGWKTRPKLFDPLNGPVWFRKINGLITSNEKACKNRTYSKCFWRSKKKIVWNKNIDLIVFILGFMARERESQADTNLGFLYRRIPPCFIVSALLKICIESVCTKLNPGNTVLEGQSRFHEPSNSVSFIRKLRCLYTYVSTKTYLKIMYFSNKERNSKIVRLNTAEMA